MSWIETKLPTDPTVNDLPFLSHKLQIAMDGWHHIHSCTEHKLKTGLWPREYLSYRNKTPPFLSLFNFFFYFFSVFFRDSIVIYGLYVADGHLLLHCCLLKWNKNLLTSLSHFIAQFLSIALIFPAINFSPLSFALFVHCISCGCVLLWYWQMCV